MIKGIIFDHDGTLVDSERVHFEIWRDVLRSYSTELNRDDYIRHHAGVPTDKNAERMVKDFDLAISAAELTATKLAAARAHLDNTAFPLYPDTHEAVALSYSAGMKMGIATGAGRVEIDSSLDSHQLRSYFGAISTRDDVKSGKPAPDVYLQCAQMLKLKAKDCIAIEDSRTGVESALAAGMEVIVIANDFSALQDLSRATYSASSLREAVVIALTKKGPYD
ncbi:HAD family hydrolase [Teredinibacter waterburyi]|uniref:HAD family hydrolase n=1 Tax=Teredinibacter waterburyi TaxID=1500538 RepID=UPI00165EEAC3|nr:HAD family phosphatase [Teredinibacter waterburyi]